MKNILVATDFSYDAYNALFYVSRLMSSTPCTFHILNVFDEFTPLNGKKSKLFGSKKLLKQLKTQSKEKLIETTHKIVLENGNAQHEFKTISEQGDLINNIIKIVDDLAIDLVVVGSKGTTGAAEIFFGSNTIKIVKNIIKCPVLAIPKQMDYREPKSIAFVTDFKTGCDKETLKPLIHLTSLTKAAVSVMHIDEEEKLSGEQESHKKLLALCLADTVHDFHQVQDDVNKARAINSFLEKNSIDLLTMVYHKRSFFERLVKEPVIKDVNIQTNIPFLMLHNPD